MASMVADAAYRQLFDGLPDCSYLYEYDTAGPVGHSLEETILCAPTTSSIQGGNPETSSHAPSMSPGTDIDGLGALFLAALGSWGACLACLYGLYGRCAAAARAIDPNLGVALDLLPSDPAQSRLFMRYLVRVYAQWMAWGDWSSLMFAVVLNLKLSMAIHPDVRAKCLQEHKFYWRPLLLLLILMKLMPLDRSKDIRVWWYANLCRVGVFWCTCIAISTLDEHRACIAAWVQDMGCWMALLLTGLTAGAVQLWFPLGVAMDAVSLPIQTLAIYAFLSYHQQPGKPSAFQLACLPLAGQHTTFSCITMATIIILKWYIHHLHLLRFMSSHVHLVSHDS